MSTKAKKTAAAPKTASAKSAPAAPKAAGKKASAKGAAPEVEMPLEAAPRTETDDEVDEDEMAAASSSSSGGGSSAAALAAATSTGEMSASFKNFRHHPDMENFYRFIYENDLRLEALTIIDEMIEQRLTRKNVRLAKTSPH